MPDLKKLFIKTYGCQMNVYDSASAWPRRMGADGYVTTEVRSPDADMILLNTCHIREKGVREALFRPWPA